MRLLLDRHLSNKPESSTRVTANLNRFKSNRTCGEGLINDNLMHLTKVITRDSTGVDITISDPLVISVFVVQLEGLNKLAIVICSHHVQDLVDSELLGWLKGSRELRSQFNWAMFLVIGEAS